MPIKNLIVALNKSNLKFDPSIIPLLWLAKHKVPEIVIESLLTSIENSSEDHPDIINALLAECDNITAFL